MSIDGTPQGDSLTDTVGNDVINGFGGDDSITVTDGNDSVDGGDGNDLVLLSWLGSSTPVVSAAALPGYQYRYESGPGRSVNLVGIEDIFITGGSANDILVSYGGNDILNDGAGNTSDNDSLSGGGGDDQLSIIAGHDLLDGGSGRDKAIIIWGGATAPIITVAAPAGYELRFESGANRSVSLVGVEDIQIASGRSDDIVTTGAGDDRFDEPASGNTGNDYFGGGDGDDLMFSFNGNDKSDGGNGDDRASIIWSSTNAPVVMGVASAGYEIRFQAEAGRSVELKNYERINFESGSGADILNFGSTRDTIFTGGGNDIVHGGGGDDFIEGGSGIDSLFGDDGDDAAILTDDSDSFTGGAGIDTAIIADSFASFTVRISTDTEVLLLASGTDVRFGPGNASYDYNIVIPNGPAGAPSLLTVQATGLVAGEDLTFSGSAQTNGAFRIFAGRGVDQLTGGSLNDGFFFDADAASSLTGADRINGGAGVDSVALRGNYDVGTALVFQDASLTAIEVIVLLSGHTNEFGGFINVSGFDYDVTLANGNVLAGQSLDIVGGNLRANESVRIDARAELDGAVRIFSGAGDDTLFGSAGADLIWGGLGADALDGSGGSDVYVYRTAGESTAASRDTIAFGAGDQIDLGTIDANGAAAGDSFAFIGSAAFTNTAGELRAYDGGGGQWIVEGDVDGDGTADLVIAVTTATPLVAGDFVL